MKNKNNIDHLFINMAGRIVAAATVRAVKNRKLLPTRAALVLVRIYFRSFFLSVNSFRNYSC